MSISTEKKIYKKLVSFMVAASCLTILSSSLCIGGSVQVYDRKVPFYPGEKLIYRARWGVLPAGDVTLEVLPKETLNGVESYHFAMITKTNSAVDLLYRIRERQDSYIDAGITHSILYKKRTVSKHPRDVIVNFNWKKQEASYTNFGEKRAPIKIVPGTFDPLALFFILRLYDFKENSVIEVSVTDSNKNFNVKATVTERQMISIGTRKYETFAVTPDMERLENIVKKSDDPQLKIWFTTDDKKIPVKIQSKIGIVSFIFELEAIAS